MREFVGVKEAALMLGKSDGTVRHMVLDGNLAVSGAKHLHATLQIDVESIRAVIAEKELRSANRSGSLVLVFAILLLELAIPAACAQPFTERNPAQDFNTLGVAGGNKGPQGVFGIDGIMLVSDVNGRIYSYDMESKERQDSPHNDRANNSLTGENNKDDFILFKSGTSGPTIRPFGLWANGSTNKATLWVAHKPVGPKVREEIKLYAYRMTWHTWQTNGTTRKYLKGTRYPDDSKDFKDLFDNRNQDPTGIWSNGETMWVADNADNILYAYDMETKRRDSSKNIDLVKDHGTQSAYDYSVDRNTSPQGIWSDGETMWVANVAGRNDSDEKRIYAYNMWTNTSAGVKMFDGSYISDGDSAKDYKTLNENWNEEGSTGIESTDNDRPRGIWSDGETMWVADQTDNKLYAYHAFRNTHDRNPTQDFDGLSSAGGLWSDGETMWIADDVADKIYAYDVDDKVRDSTKEIDTNNTNTNSVDIFKSYIWSDGTNMWVSSFDRKGTSDWTAAATNRGDDTAGIYSFKLSDGSRDKDKDFSHLINTNLTYRGNDRPRGLWSDGETMWVAERDDSTNAVNKIYAYDLATKSRVPNQDFNTLHGAGNRDPAGLWSDGETMWVGDDAEDKIYAYDLATKARADAKDYDTLDAAGNQHIAGLWSDGETMWVADSDDSKVYAYNRAVEARLGDLLVTGHVPSPGYEDFVAKLDPIFNSGVMEYDVSVPFATERLTLSAKTLRPHDVLVLPADVDDEKDGVQVDLAVGLNTLEILVENGDTGGLPQTRTYKINVTREFFTFNDPSKDIDLAFTNGIQGIWANGTTIWVADSGENKLHAYKKSDGSRDSIKDIPLASANSEPRGIWSNGATMWVVEDSEDGKIYAYGLTSRTRLNSTNDFELNADNANPQWIWSDGTTMWVTDTNKIFAYKMSGDKERDESREIDLGGLVNDNKARKEGIWSDGANLWVANNDPNNAKIYSYKLAGNRIDCREETKDFNTLEDANNHNPKAIFSDGSIMYVADSEDGKIYAYNQPLSGNARLKTLTLSGDVYYGAQPFQLSNSTTHYKVWVDSATTETTLIVGAQNPDAIGVDIVEPEEDANSSLDGYQVELNAGNNPIRITVTAENGDSKLYTVNIYRIGNDRRIRQLDFDLNIGNELKVIRGHEIPPGPTGIWSDGATMWVVDGNDKAVYAYKMGGEEWGQLDADKGFPLELGDSPGGIWGHSHTNTIWVSAEPYRIHAFAKEKLPIEVNYKLANSERELNLFGKRDPDKDIVNTNRLAEFVSPGGLWGNDETMWVVDSRGIIFAYNLNNLTNVTRSPSKDIPIRGGERDIWSNGTTMWVLNDLTRTDAEHKLYAYTLNLSATEATNRISRDAGKDIAITDSIGGRAIWSNGEVMWVASTETGTGAEDGGTEVTVPARILAYRMPTASGATGGSDFFFSEDSTLKDLQLSGATLTPAFSADNLYYSALVDHTVHSATVTATPTASMAEVDILSGGRGTTRRTARKGPQVSLEEGYNIIAIDVLAESRTAQSTYLIRVTKAEAPPTSGGPLPVFQAASASSSSAARLGEWKSQLILAEPLADGGVRFVFAVPNADEFGIEETPALWGETWRPLPEEEVTILRESNGGGSDRLTIILPKAAGKQRFLRLTPRK